MCGLGLTSSMLRAAYLAPVFETNDAARTEPFEKDLSSSSDPKNKNSLPTYVWCLLQFVCSRSRSAGIWGPHHRDPANPEQGSGIF